jgi:DNA-binding CsgD family transcriptional regulator
MPLGLSTAEQKRLTALADTLLSPLVAERPEQWREDVDVALRLAFGCDHVMFVTPEDGKAVFRSPSLEPDILQRFADLTTPDPRTGLFASKDPVVDTWFRARRADRLEVFTEVGNSQMLAALGHDMRRSEIANTVWQGGMLDFFGLMTEAAGSEMMLITGYERRGAARLSDDAIRQRLQLVLPAFRAGHHAFVRFGETRAALTRTLDFMSDALLLFDRSGRELYRNAACRGLLADEPESESLLAACRRMSLAVNAPRIHKAAGHEAVDPPAAEQGIKTARQRYVARAVPAAAAMFNIEGAVLLSLARATAVAVSDEELRAKWGLTPREIDVVRLLAIGLRNADIAQRLAVSPSTARNHTERVMLKLGVSSRARVGPLLRGELDDAN